ncbi:MAG: serine protease [Hyphomicrobiales bacterium]|nr:serine protease [Hyphomicrobiales bacterium]
MSNASDQLIHTTVRIECCKADGTQIAGTGFVFNFCQRDEGSVPAIVTNRHVVEGAETGVFHMTLRGDDGGPRLGEYVEVPLEGIKTAWIGHPSTAIDLAAIPLAPVINWLHEDGKKAYYIGLHREFLADAEFMAELTAVEDVLMIGYPNGLWDSQHNLPIVRRGITATPPYVDFNGKPEFMIDCACFPGSSGSPVVLYNMGGHTKKSGAVVLGSGRVKLLGVLWGGPKHTARGDIEIVPVPSAVQPIALSPIPINLGYCVKADQLLAFEEYFEALISEEAKTQIGEEAEPAA